MRILIWSIAMPLALAWGLAHAQAYRWVDKDGKVRYGDFPPPGAKTTAMKAPPGPASPPPAAAKDTGTDKKGPMTPAQQEQDYRDRQAKAKATREKDEKGLALAEQLRQNCASAQGTVRSIESGQRQTSTSPQGETIYLDDAQVQEKLARARKAAAEACK